MLSYSPARPSFLPAWLYVTARPLLDVIRKSDPTAAAQQEKRPSIRELPDKLIIQKNVAQAQRSRSRPQHEDPLPFNFDATDLSDL